MHSAPHGLDSHTNSLFAYRTRTGIVMFWNRIYFAWQNVLNGKDSLPWEGKCDIDILRNVLANQNKIKQIRIKSRLQNQLLMDSTRKNAETHRQSPAQGDSLNRIEEETDRERERKIRKLTQVNRELIETLKKQNEELTKKINKQKSKSKSRSVSGVDQADEKVKTQLANAYKQIQMYKNALLGIKAKEISAQSSDKQMQIECRLRSLQNSIKEEQNTIEKLQKQLRYLKNIKEQQQKELSVYQNEDVKASVGELQTELKSLKEKLKNAKEQTKQREGLEKKQHAYCMELEKMLRKHNDEYYPNKAEKDKKEEVQDIPEREWQVVKAELAELKKSHEEYNKKIENLSRLRNKELKSCQENELSLKEKKRKLQTVRAKIAELKKLVTFREKTPEALEEEPAEEGDDRYESIIKNGKKVYRLKNPQKEREAKKWNVPTGYCLERGKILPNSTFFSDKPSLKDVQKSKIIEIRVWSDAAGAVALMQCVYQSEDGRKHQGIMPYPSSYLQGLQEKIVEFKEGDYLAKIRGKFVSGFLTSLTFISKFGKIHGFNDIGLGQDFSLQPRPNEIPSCVFGACVRNDDDEIKVCHIGCEFVADW